MESIVKSPSSQRSADIVAVYSQKNIISAAENSNSFKV